jgi:membrane protease YdiL (CAAX protease family)
MHQDYRAGFGVANYPTTQQILLYLTVLFIAQLVIGTVFFYTFPGYDLILSETLIFLVPTLILVHASEYDVKRLLRLNRPRRLDVIICIPLSIALYILSDQLGNLLDPFIPASEVFSQKMVELVKVSAPYDWAIKPLGIILLVPVAEEILFRGYVLSGLEHRFGTQRAIFFSAVAFSLFHGYPAQWCPTLLAGIVIAIVAIKTNSVYTSILLHLGFNLSAFVLVNFGDGSTTLGDPLLAPWYLLLPALAVMIWSLRYYLTDIQAHYRQGVRELSEARPGRHSLSGTLSLAFAVAGLSTSGMLFFLKVLLAKKGADLPEQQSVIGLTTLMAVGLLLAGIVFGVNGLLSKTEERTFAILGTVLSGLPLLFLVLITLLGIWVQ